ncbi:MAG: hypothetical protein M2R46_03900 [Verrucomicrobia subdivision 3 bacterium]|nr:hypothetical protein [Limisphaerales bacterium]
MGLVNEHCLFLPAALVSGRCSKSLEAQPSHCEGRKVRVGGAGVAAIFHWFGKIPSGVSSAFGVNLDLYATVASAMGNELPKDYSLDSLDLSGVLFDG